MTQRRIKPTYRVEIIGKDLSILFAKNFDQFKKAKEWRSINFPIYVKKFGKPLYNHIVKIKNGKRTVIN